MVGACWTGCHGPCSFRNRELLSGRDLETSLKQTSFPDQVSLGLLLCPGILCSLVLAAEFGIKTLLRESKCPAYRLANSVSLSKFT